MEKKLSSKSVNEYNNEDLGSAKVCGCYKLCVDVARKRWKSSIGKYI